MRILNRTRGTELASDARAAHSPWSRMVGLLGRASLAPGEGLLIDPCSSVHTAFMRFPIDLIYLDRERTVVKVVPNLRPFRASAVLGGARSVVELPVGVIERSATQPGDELDFED